MIPKGLKIGDTFVEQNFDKQILYEVVGIDGWGNYISKVVKDDPAVEEAEEEVGELPFVSTDSDVEETVEKAEEQPAVEEPKEVKEVKKATPKKKTTSTKKKTATKKK